MDLTQHLTHSWMKPLVKKLTKRSGLWLECAENHKTDLSRAYLTLLEGVSGAGRRTAVPFKPSNFQI